MVVFSKLFDQLGHRQAGIEKTDTRTGRHDPRNIGLGRFEHIIDQHALSGVDDASFFTLFEQGSKLIGMEYILPINVLADDIGRDSIRHQPDGFA